MSTKAGISPLRYKTLSGDKIDTNRALVQHPQARLSSKALAQMPGQRPELMVSQNEPGTVQSKT